MIFFSIQYFSGSVNLISLYCLCPFRYELRVRYLPKSFHDLLAKDRVTFYYFYDQVSQNFTTESNISTLHRLLKDTLIYDSAYTGQVRLLVLLPPHQALLVTGRWSPSLETTMPTHICRRHRHNTKDI